MSIQAGKLRHRIRFEQRGASQDPDTGEMIPDAWALAFEVWASVQPMSTRDVIAARERDSSATHRIIIRYRAGVDSQMRIVFRGVVHELVGDPLADMDSGLEYLTLMTSTGLTDG